MNRLFVFDTNVIISAVILPDSVNGRAFFKALENDLLIVSEGTLEELKSVLFRKKFDKYLPDDSERLTFIHRISEASILVRPEISITACRDPKDNKFLEVAVVAKASGIITGNDDLLILNPFREIPIINASDFLSRF